MALSTARVGTRMSAAVEPPQWVKPDLCLCSVPWLGVSKQEVFLQAAQCGSVQGLILGG